MSVCPRTDGPLWRPSTPLVRRWALLIDALGEHAERLATLRVAVWQFSQSMPDPRYHTLGPMLAASAVGLKQMWDFHITTRPQIEDGFTALYGEVFDAHCCCQRRARTLQSTGIQQTQWWLDTATHMADTADHLQFRVQRARALHASVAAATLLLYDLDFHHELDAARRRPHR